MKDFDHPGHDVIVSFVDQHLDAADTEWVEAHLEVCTRCREDVDDLRAMQRELVTTTGAETIPAARRWTRWAVAGGAVAAAALAFVLTYRPADVQEPDSMSASNTPAPLAPPAPPASPAPLAPHAPPAPSARLAAAEARLVERALAAGSVPRPDFDTQVRLQPGTLLSGSNAGETLRVMGPLGTAVESERPTFSWASVPGATTYTVSVFDPQFNVVASSDSRTGTSWRVDRDLPRGVVLAWQVAAERPTGRLIGPAPPQPEARFIVLPAASVARLNEQRARLANEPLALGLVFAEAGLIAEAEAALTRAIGDPRYDVATVKRLIAEIR